MGQKSSKSSTHYIREFNPTIITLNAVSDTVSSSSSASSSYSSSSKSKSNHESAISNDSGCYINDRYSSPSGSSVLCIFDLANEATLNKASNVGAADAKSSISKESSANDLTIKKRARRNEKGASCKPGSRSKTLTKDSSATSHNKRTSLNEPATAMISTRGSKSSGSQSKRTSKRTKSTSSQTNDESNRFSFCDSLDYSYSLTSSSSSCLNLETIDENLSSSSGSNKYKISRIENRNINKYGDQIDYLQVAAHSLCDQLNQILSISAGLTSESMNFSNRKELLDNLANVSKSKSKNELFKKTLSSVESNVSQSDLSAVVKEDARRSRIDHADAEKTSNATASSANKSAKPKHISRSHTFHAEQNGRRRLNQAKTNQGGGGGVESQAAKLKLAETGHKNMKLVSNEDEIIELEKLDGYKTAKVNNSSKMTKSLLKNGRRLFTWNRKASAGPDARTDASRKHKNDFERVEAPYLQNNVRANSLEDQLINLIAAKLMSESIELAQPPYSDEFGFCKIPIALVKRYSIELKRSVDLVAKCMETERLSQLEKSGKIGIPNDFLVNSCKCVNTNALTNSDSEWHACKCDIDLSSIGAFFYRVGLPMYAETALKKSSQAGSTDDYFKTLFAMNESEIEREYKMDNGLHLSIIASTIEKAKGYLI